jgi:hypothetical protein
VDLGGWEGSGGILGRFPNFVWGFPKFGYVAVHRNYFLKTIFYKFLFAKKVFI